jgi:hypothetical protein
MALHKKAEKLRPIRDKLAHGKVVPMVRKGGEIEFRYLPFYHFSSHKSKEVFDKLTATEIYEIRDRFVSLIRELAEFGKKIGAVQQIKSQGKLL